MKPNWLMTPFLGMLFCAKMLAQPAHFELSIHRATAPITLDGQLDEPAWQSAQVAKNFKLNYPIDSIYSNWPTEARLTFDDKNLYVGYICYQNRADYTVQSLRRDFGPGTTDVINVSFDPFRDGLNGYLFAVSPLNVQREAAIANGKDMNLVWDNKWASEVQNFDDRWVVEIAIPFKTLRYKLAPDGQQNRWGMNFIRTKLKDFETGTWAPVPSQFHPVSLAFAGSLVWADAPPGPGLNISLIPYATAGLSTDFLRNAQFEKLPSDQNFTRNIGGDAKIGITPGLNLDLTFNPDFSQVEVDRQVANVSRFELFFPETRQFFIENEDLFGKFGFPSSRPFFSRRVGLAENPLTKNLEKVPILAGARLSGKLTDKLRIGLLNMTTDRKDWDATNVQPGANFTVAILQRRIQSRSTIAGIFVDKTNFLGKLSDAQRAGFQPFNRMAGLEYNLFSKNNKWEGEAYFHRSFSPDKRQRGNTYAGFLGYSGRTFQFNLGHFAVDSFYTADAGFVPRHAIRGLYPGMRFTHWPKNSAHVRTVSIGTGGDLTYGWKGEKLDYGIDPNVSVEFKDQATIRAGLYLDYTYLYEPFDPTGGLIGPGEDKLPVGAYPSRGVNLEAGTGTSDNFQGSFRVETGSHFEGSKFISTGNLAYRVQPVGLFSMNFAYFHIKQPGNLPSADFYLIGPKAEVSFRRDLFLSAFFQYNTQANNFNLNARLQWRFRPVSDVFLVYTDNSYAQSVEPHVRFFTPKSRAIVLKVVYWLNV